VPLPPSTVRIGVVRWIANEPLRKADFFETATGNCRLMSPICAKLSQTAPVWGKLVAPWSEYVARALWTSGAGTGRTRISLPPTRLTQQRRTEAKGKVWMAAIAPPKTDHLCRGCGKTLANGSTNCVNCAVGGIALAKHPRVGVH
jgi:hypothetical protein